jgi:sorting nexin-29
MLYNILLSMLIPYADEVIRDHQCGFRRNSSTTDHIYCIRQILEEKWEYNQAVYQLFIEFKKAYDTVRREVLYNILKEFEVPKNRVKLIKMCLPETYSRFRVGKNIFDMFPIREMLYRHFLSTLLWSMPLGVFR